MYQGSVYNRTMLAAAGLSQEQWTQPDPITLMKKAFKEDARDVTLFDEPRLGISLFYDDDEEIFPLTRDNKDCHIEYYDYRTFSDTEVMNGDELEAFSVTPASKKVKIEKEEKPVISKVCENCKTIEATLWRRVEDLTLCNPCALHLKKYKAHRPSSRWNEVTKTRNRQKKSSPRILPNQAEAPEDKTFPDIIFF